MTRGTIGRRIGIGRCITVDERVRRRDGLMSRTKTPVLAEFGALDASRQVLTRGAIMISGSASSCASVSIPCGQSPPPGFAHYRVKFDALPDGVSGVLLRRDDLALVAVNAAHPELRQRFTIAHEIGHFMLHKDVYIDTTTRTNERVSRTRSKSAMG